MQGSQFKFQKGQPYVIINKAQDMALRVALSNNVKIQQLRISGQPFNPQDDSQLFMLQKIGEKGEVYQIINIVTNRVLTASFNQIKLLFGKQFSQQLFTITKSPFQGFFTYFWIQNASQKSKTLSFDRYLKYGQFHSVAQDQMFRFQPVVNNNTIRESFVIYNKPSNKVLDVPMGTLQASERIIQYQFNNRWNQRWKWITQNRGYLIQNLLTKLCLDIEGESRESGAAVIQWKKTGNSNQLWLPQAVGNGSYRIRSIHNSSLFLCIKSDSLDNGGKLQVSDQLKPSMFWLIEGALP